MSSDGSDFTHNSNDYELVTRSESNESSQYSNWVNSGARRSVHIVHYPDYERGLGRTPHPSPSFEPASIAGVHHAEPCSATINSVPPRPVSRIVSRQTTVRRLKSDVERPKTLPRNPSLGASNRSSLSYGGDLTLDDETRQDFFQILPVTRFKPGLESKGGFKDAQDGYEDSFYESTTLCRAKSPASSSPSDYSWKPEDIPLPPSPVLTGDYPNGSHDSLQYESKVAKQTLDAVACHQNEDMRPLDEAFSSVPVATADTLKQKRMEPEKVPQDSPYSSLLDLYLGVSRKSSISSAPRSSVKAMGGSVDVPFKEVQARNYDAGYSLGLPTKKLKTWISKRMGRPPISNKERPATAASYQELSQQAVNEVSRLKSTGRIGADGCDSPASMDPDLNKQSRKHSPLKVSQEGFIYEQERYASGINGFTRSVANAVDGATMSEDRGSSRFIAIHDVHLDNHQQDESSQPLSIRQKDSKSFVSDVFHEPEELDAASAGSVPIRESTDFSHSLRACHRTPTWFSDRNMPPSRPSTRANSSNTSDSFPYELQNGIQEANIAEHGDRRDEPGVHQAFGYSAASLKSTEPHGYSNDYMYLPREERDTRLANADSRMPGSYPIGDRGSAFGTDPQAMINIEVSNKGISGNHPGVLPLIQKSSKQIPIAGHKPAHERERYPEPFFVPSTAPEAQDMNNGREDQTRTINDDTELHASKKMRDNVRHNIKPVIQPRISSSTFRPQSASVIHRTGHQATPRSGSPRPSWEIDNGAYVVEFRSDQEATAQMHTLDGESSFPQDRNEYERIDTKTPWVTAAAVAERTGDLSREGTLVKSARQGSVFRSDAEEKLELHAFQKGHRRHHSFRGRIQASLHRANRKGVLARDWSVAKKRFAAIVACISTALVGLIVGIYAGQVPAIQYAIVDEQTHHAVLGNVFFYLGLAITTIVAWPLPLLYGRKRFTLAGMAVVLVLQFPQALVCSQQRNPSASIYRIGLLLPRFVSGLFIGFANMNFWPALLDVYGSSLQSQAPHQETVNQNDPRRHGGGMGIWLGIWTWCHIGSIGLGFVIGAVIIGYLNVAWGFWIVIFASLTAMLLNVIGPETRNSAFRKSMAEVRKGADVSRRVGRGEIMMHLYSTGPLHWWEEMRAGLVLNFRMIKQSGFVIMALYQGWIYGQVVMIMILLGALASRYYRLQPPSVGLCVAAFPIGALLAVPFQKASLFSRSRHRSQRTDSMTFEKRVSWSSHLVRRSVFMAALPLAAAAYTLTSTGPALSIALPVLFAAFIGFLTNLALSECYGLIMETFDTSDLQPGMTGRLRKELSEDVIRQRTNFSCYPRVTAGFSIVQTISFVIAAVATAVGGNVERARGVQTATGFVAAVLFGLTLLLIGALTRFRTVQIVPTNRVSTAELSGPGEDLPVIIGSPSGTTRRISLLELGNMTRWTEIRRRNKLLGSGRHGKYP